MKHDFDGHVAVLNFDELWWRLSPSSRRFVVHESLLRWLTSDETVHCLHPSLTHAHSGQVTKDVGFIRGIRNFIRSLWELICLL